MILAIDPGNEQSAYAVLDQDLRPVDFGILKNANMFGIILNSPARHFVIEMVASYGMAVGQEVFETCVWIGRFLQFAEERGAFRQIRRILRMDEKIMLCHDSRAKDANIRQALIDRFGPVGTKANKGWFYGVSKDVWSAIAIGVTYNDLYLTGGNL